MALSAQVTKDFWPYWRKTVERFGQLEITSLKLGQYDVYRNQLPETVEIESMPALVMFPAKDKTVPYKRFHGKAKVRPIMLWAQEVASLAFDFPNDTPHLDDEQRAYQTHCNTLQHTATHCNTLQHTATHCNTLHHTATHCIALQLVYTTD